MSGAEDFPHVTSIIASVGLIDTSHYTEADREFGTAVHAATEYHDRGELDPDSLHPRVAARLAQWERFRAESGITIVTIEEVVINSELRYRGRADRRVRLNGRIGILDIKGPSEERSYGVQTAAYAHAMEGVTARWTMHLHDDRYKLIEWTERSDWDVFRAALAIHNWKARNA